MITREEAEHGAYNGWCRVEGIPVKADDCLRCVLVESAAMRACIDRLRDGWYAYNDPSLGLWEWRQRAPGDSYHAYEPMTEAEQAVMSC